MNINLLKELCMSCGISGDETEIRQIIIEQIKDYATSIEQDNMGNLLVFKKGKNTAKNKLLISAHMDEVGFIVTDITPDGYIKFTEVGGVDRRVVIGKAGTIGKNKVNGVVSAKPVHLMEAEEGKRIPKYSQLSIDIGAVDKEEALQAVRIGDSIQFTAPFHCNDGVIMGKALDDRAGCLVLIEMIRQELAYDTWFSFVVQEEVGLRGAKCAAFTIDPQFSIVVEATTAADIPNIDDSRQVCNVGEGAVVSFMDKRTIYDRELTSLAVHCAESAGVKVQLKKAVAGGNDAGAIHVSKGGVRTAAVSVPCRYLHSACGLITQDDLQAVYQTVAKLAEEITSGAVH